MYYFAYGMNSDPGAMKERTGRSRALGAATIHGYRLRFAYYADVVKAPGSVCHGVLWDITKEHLQSLDGREGFPYYYNRKRIKVTCGGRTYRAWVYYMNAGEPLVPPTQSYYDMLLRGYKHFGADTHQIIRALAEADRAFKGKWTDVPKQRADRATDRMPAVEQYPSSMNVNRSTWEMTDAEWREYCRMVEDEQISYSYTH